jgi:hypothetical protein
MLLSRLWDKLPPDQRPWAIHAAWALSDFPEECLRRDEWLKMFGAVGYIENDFHVTPPDQITLWRCGVRETGMWWTAKRSTAEWFQHRFVPDKPAGKLWRVTVGADRLLAHFDQHCQLEDEFVVDPAGLEPTEVF